jgi:hypothetical protein
MILFLSAGWFCDIPLRIRDGGDVEVPRHLSAVTVELNRNSETW